MAHGEASVTPPLQQLEHACYKELDATAPHDPSTSDITT